MQQALPLKRERVLYTTATGPDHFTFLLVDPESNNLHVSIVKGKERQQFQLGNGEMYLPQEIARRLAEHTK